MKLAPITFSTMKPNFTAINSLAEARRMNSLFLASEGIDTAVFEDPLGQKARAKNALATALDRDWLGKNSRRWNICEFGCGMGLSTKAIKDMFEYHNITAIDNDPEFAKDFPSEISIYGGENTLLFKNVDGIEFLNDGKRKFNLVMASMLAPEIEPAEILKAVPNSLLDGGNFLTYSDSGTIRILKEYLDENGIKYNSFNQPEFDTKGVVVSKEELLKL